MDFIVNDRIGRDCSVNKNPLTDLWRRWQIRRWRRSRCGEWSRRYRSRLHRAAVSGRKLLIFTNFETPPWHRAGTDRGTLGIRARLRVAGHPYHPGGRSGEVVGAPQLSWRIVLQRVFFYLGTTLTIEKLASVSCVSSEQLAPPGGRFNGS